MLKYEIVNVNEIPDDLPLGEYNTQIVSTELTSSELIIRLKFLGTKYDRNNPQCLLPLIKHDVNDEPHYLDEG